MGCSKGCDGQRSQHVGKRARAFPGSQWSKEKRWSKVSGETFDHVLVELWPHGDAEQPLRLWVTDVTLELFKRAAQRWTAGIDEAGNQLI